MSDSVISMIFLGVLGVLFILLVVLTIILIVTRKKDSKESSEDYDEEYEDYEALEDEDSEEEADFSEDYSDEEDNYSEDYSDEEDNYSEDYSDEEADSYEDYSAEEDNSAKAYPAEDQSAEEGNSAKAYGDNDENSVEENKSMESSTDEPENVQNYRDELGDYSDSAFAPYQGEDSLSNEEAIMASVKEAEAMSEAVIHGKSISHTEAVFGLSDELASYDKKKPSKKSNVSSNDDFYWYNKNDVDEKPSYKTKEMYYHYFNLPADCIEDLLVEMYDCALVRTEEIRYIAYGIEPKAVSIKDILSEGNYYYKDQPKRKDPLPQDLIKIYEKWCGYVDKLFDKVEIHADEFTIQEIRRLLYEFGRNDVDVLIEGK